MNRFVFAVIFAIGLVAVAWVGVGFVGSSWLALAMTALIGGVYLLGAWELKQFRDATTSLSKALADIPQPLASLAAWLEPIHPALQHPVRMRIEGERVALPGPALTPYLVGLLVMLGMLGTFLGMVVTFKGVVFALEGSADLQAIRSALAAPIKGLGLSFGTSVAGVASSAMLGLLSAISRSDRVKVLRLLDTRAAAVFRPLSLAHQRQDTYKALQAQAQALPEMVTSLQAMMHSMERRSQQLNEQLLGQQAQFHHDVASAYTDLAGSVGQSLKDSLSASARAAGESLQPVVEAAMSAIAQESVRTHQRLVDATQTQLNGLSTQFEATARTVSDGWATTLQTHARTSENQAVGLDRALSAFTAAFEQGAHALLTTVNEAAIKSQSDQALADQHRLEAWTGSLAAMADRLRGEWQRVGTETLAQQHAVCQALQETATEITERTSEQASRTLDGMTQLLGRSEALISSRMDAEAQWTQQQGLRMDQLASLWRQELAALRQEEAERGQAAVEQLADLQAAMSIHLATLGAALEAPMTRLMQTASEVPQAAAGLMAQLREDMSRISERDNLALHERTAVMDKINALLLTIHQSSGEQRAAIESLSASAQAVMAQASGQFADTVKAQAGKAEGIAAHVASSAIELASLGESFSHGIGLFSASNEKLMNSLQRIEGAISQSMARSDEQLAYYVAQAREVIDLSITSQQGIVEDLRRLHGQPAARLEGRAA